MLTGKLTPQVTSQYSYSDTTVTFSPTKMKIRQCQGHLPEAGGLWMTAGWMLTGLPLITVTLQ